MQDIYNRCLRFSASAEIGEKAQLGIEPQTSVSHSRTSNDKLVKHKLMYFKGGRSRIDKLVTYTLMYYKEVEQAIVNQ